MSLEAYRDSIEDLEDTLRSFYVHDEKSGKWRLDVAGGFKTPEDIEGLTSALAKERARADRNEKEAKERERMLQEKEEALRQQREAKNELSEEDRKRKEDEKRLLMMQEELNRLRQENAERAKREEEQSKRLFLQQSGVLSKAASKSVQYWMETNLPQYIKFEDGKPVVVDADGNRIYDADSIAPLDPVRSLEKLALNNPDGKNGITSDIKGNGSGSFQSLGGNVPTGKNPFTKQNWNRTDQMKLIATDPSHAKTLAQAAGVKVTW